MNINIQVRHDMNKIKLIKLEAVIEMTTLSRSAIYRGIRECRFPKQVRLSHRSVAWVESDIQNWIKAQIAERQNI